MKKIKLYNEDCLARMDKLIAKGVKVDMVLTDLPYGTTRNKWDSIIPLDAMWERLNKLIKPNGAIVLFGSQPFTSSLVMSNPKSYKYDWVWEKNKATGHLNAKKQPMNSNELVSVFYGKQCVYNPQGLILKDKPTISKGNRGTKLGGSSGACYDKANKDAIQTHSNYPRRNIQFDVDIKAEFHPTQKPVALMEYLVKTYTNEGETVLDFTMGSGTTGVACKNTKRKFIGIELDETYFKIAKDRINENNI